MGAKKGAKKGGGTAAQDKKAKAAALKAKNKQILDELKAKFSSLTKELASVDAQLKELEADQTGATADSSKSLIEHDELLRQYDLISQEEKDLETILSNCEREIEEVKDVSKAEIRVFQKKVKHLMAANQHEFGEVNIQSEEQIFQKRKEQLYEASDYDRTATESRSDERDLFLKNSTLLSNLRLDQDKKHSQHRDEFERSAEALRAEHDQRVKLMRAQLEERRIKETEELERRKNEQITNLQKNHAVAFEKIKRFYSGVVHNNLEVIKQNKGKLAEKNTKINLIKKEVDDKISKKRKIEIPLNSLIAENEKLRKEIEVYNKDKSDLKRNKEMIREQEAYYKDQQLTLEVLEQRTSQVEAERDGLYDQFENSIHDVRQKTEFRAFVLEQKVKKLNEELEIKELELQRVMQEHGLDATAISSRIEDVLAVKNAKINELEVELAKVIRARNDILTAFEAKMDKYGIPYEKDPSQEE